MKRENLRKSIRKIAGVVIAAICVSSYSVAFAGSDSAVSGTSDLIVVATAEPTSAPTSAPTATVESTVVPDVTIAPEETPKLNKNIRSGDFVYRITDVEEKEAIIRNYKGKSSDMVIPAEIDGYKVTAFNPELISRTKRIKKIYIPETVTEIYEAEDEEGGYFLGWPNLKKINVSEDNPVYYSDRGILIDKSRGYLLACPDKNRIKNYVVPENIKVIYAYAFSLQEYISHVYINHDGVKLFDCAFQGSALKSITIKGTTPFISWDVFYGCKKLKKVQWKGGFENIYPGVFEDCKKLKKIVIPSSVRYISGFSGCDGLKVVKFKRGIKKKYVKDFSDCKNLKKVYWPKSAKKLDKSILPKGCKVIRY